MDKEIEDYTYDELITYLAGQALMSLGAGKSIRSITYDIAHSVNLWTVRVVIEKKGVGKVDKAKE